MQELYSFLLELYIEKQWAMSLETEVENRLQTILIN